MNIESPNSFNMISESTHGSLKDIKNGQSYKAHSILNLDELVIRTHHPKNLSDHHSADSFSPDIHFRSFCSSTNSSPKKEILSDRFIPIRQKNTSTNMFELPNNLITSSDKLDMYCEDSRNKIKYNSILENQLLDIKHTDFFSKLRNSPRKLHTKVTADRDSQIGYTRDADEFGYCHSPSKILSFKSPVKRKKRLEEVQQNRFMDIEKEEEEGMLETFKEYRKISKTPYKILDAPCLTGDFYLELINWSSRNQLAVALGNTVWLWNGDSGKVSKFCLKKQADIEYTAVQWDPKGDILTAGDSEGIVELWDSASSKMIFQCRNNIDRIDCVSWNSPNVFSTGSRDATILTYDLRAGCKPIIKFHGHNDEVCGLKWSPNGNTLASGGNDNKVFLWNLRKQEPEARIDSHKAAIKALAWSPHQQNLLLTGGGSSDKTIKIWNTLSMTMISEISTPSQVCNLLFSKTSNEFVSTHGLYDNQIIVWKYPELEKICVIDRPNSHSDRVLYLSESPNGENIVTGSSDETLKFWNVFPPKENKKHSNLRLSIKDLR